MPRTASAPDAEVLAFSIAMPRPAGRARRQGHRRRLQHLDRGGHRRRSGGATTCRSSASSGPGASAAALATRNRRVGVIATPATIRSHAYFGAIKDENPAIEVYEHATPTLVPLVEAGELAGPIAEAAVAEALAPLLGERDAAGESIFPRPPGASIDTLLLGCTHYPLLRAIIAGLAGEHVAIVDSATATASALAELLDINALEADDALDAPTATHRQLTTGDPASFHALASRLFGDGVPRRRARRARGGRPMTGRSNRPSARPSWRDDRVWQAGFLIGSALGAAATVAGRHAEKAARRGLVDWPEVERIAIGRLRAAPGTLDPAELRAAEPAYAEAMARIVPALSAALGSELPGVVERAGVVDRAGWVHANTGSFASLMSKIETDLLDQVMPPGGGLAKATMALANRWVTTRQLGLLLGFMGSRVLGQYDLALLTAEAPPGKLLFVEENIRATARALGVPLGPFRTWIALHETTHAFEFEAHPWLRPYLAERLERQLTLFGARCARAGPRGAARARAVDPRRGRRGALARTADGPGAEGAVPRDAGRDEPARGVQRLRHGRGRTRPRPRRRPRSANGSTNAGPSAPRSSARCSG